MNPKPPPNPPPNDAIIGRVFRWSLVVVLTVAAIVMLGVMGYRDAGDVREPAGTGKVEGPRERMPGATQPPPVVSFTDITRRAGIDFVHVNGARINGTQGDKLLPETMGGGVAVFDYDADGNQDLLFVNGTHWPGDAPKSDILPTMALYRNDGTGRFRDVTADAGLAVGFYGMGAAVGDFDNDGWVDVFFTAVGPNRLFRNEQGRFRDVTALAGVAGEPDAWSTGSAFIDYDNDGDLDLFVGNYVRWSRDIDLAVGFQLTGIGRAYGPPTTFAGSYPYLYRNDGEGRFTDVSGASGVRVDNPATLQPMAKTLGVVPVDVDGDGYLDIFLANDTVRNFLLHNQADGTFREAGVMFGVAFDRNGAATGAMGSDAAYYRNDGDLGLAVGNFANEMTSLYVTQGGDARVWERRASLQEGQARPNGRYSDDVQFADEAIGEGIGTASRLALTFGLFFFDYDLDGRLDLFQANGHLEQEINLVQSSQYYEQSPQLFWNRGPDARSSFGLVAPRQPSPGRGGGLSQRLVGRGAAFGDLDNDGDLDVVITQVGRRPVLLRNDQGLGHHWLRIELTGNGAEGEDKDRRVNRDAIGAWVEVTSGRITQRRQVMPARSYLSQVELPLTFGLGAGDTIDSIRIFWPGGGYQEVDVKDIRLDSQVNVVAR
ncbi:MAG: Repeat domain-containing protein [Candidatus Kentron sp. G]|nr:MAG: Repeat domain-containing protein [Candidatus Kentron sp. G]VFM99784.1 MAG: Repeat domain-containing protein [Candidatus Kentron sp. G]VFN01453.1 MAG: Repeat domain-containing protein [Candidatus Kentron sp. G]